MEVCQRAPSLSTLATIKATANPAATVVAPEDRDDTPWTLPTLDNSMLVLTIFGHVPYTPILETGAKHVMDGINFAKQFRLIGSK